jgi:ribosomal-protein-alanine N-acetyltransferase
VNDAIDQVMTVMEAAFEPAYGEAWNRKQLLDALQMPGTYLLLAGTNGGEPTEGGEIVGFALSRAVLGEEELLLLAVHPAHRGRGLGTVLLERFVATARARGSARLFLEMRDGNAAETLYRRLGFISIALRRDYYRRGAAGPFDAITFALDC